MFTGIIESFGIIKKIEPEGTNLNFTIESDISKELQVDESVSHDGICLTVVNIENQTYQVTAVLETIKKTNLGSWKVGDFINLERAMILGSRLDGHIVQGHVDCTAVCIDREEVGGSYLFSFSFPEKYAALIIEKGSISINGVSLTVFNVKDNSFSVTIIPYTLKHTNFNFLTKEDVVNIEFDIIGKYILRSERLKNTL